MNRKPIIAEGTVFQTIASITSELSNPIILGIYSNISLARSNMSKDIEEYKQYGGGGKYFAIRRTTRGVE